MAVLQGQSAQFNLCNSTSFDLKFAFHLDVAGSVKGCYPQSVKCGQYLKFEHCGAAGTVGAIAYEVVVAGESVYCVAAWSCLPVLGNKVLSTLQASLRMYVDRF